jgi:hypothetical protein
VFRLGYLAPLLFVAACTGEIQSQNLEGLSPAEQVAQTMWVEKALPIFIAHCTQCHDGSMPNIGYIAGTDDLMRRETLVNYVPRIVNLGAPQSSRVLTKGDHTATGGGPALSANEASDILMWIIAEAKARPAPPVIRTMQMPAIVCTTTPADPACLNTVDLSSLGQAATLTFVLQAVGSDSYYTSLKLTAGANGLYVEHPLIESWPAGATDPKPDPVDRFFAIQENLTANMALTLGETGTASIAGFNANDPISFRFDVFEAKH